MKKSLVMLAALVSCLAFAGTAVAMDWWCHEMPIFKIICKDTVLCKGKAKGVCRLCGPCAPVVKWKGKWMTVARCPESEGGPTVVVKEKAFSK